MAKKWLKRSIHIFPIIEQYWAIVFTIELDIFSIFSFKIYLKVKSYFDLQCVFQMLKPKKKFKKNISKILHLRLTFYEWLSCYIILSLMGSFLTPERAIPQTFSVISSRWITLQKHFSQIHPPQMFLTTNWWLVHATYSVH